MALPCVLATALVLVSSGHAALTISASSAKAEFWEQAVAVECTSVALEYKAGRKLKKTHSDNCPEHKNPDDGKDKYQNNSVPGSESEK